MQKAKVSAEHHPRDLGQCYPGTVSQEWGYHGLTNVIMDISRNQFSLKMGKLPELVSLFILLL